MWCVRQAIRAFPSTSLQASIPPVISPVQSSFTTRSPHVKGDPIVTGEMATFLGRLAGFNTQGPNAGFMSLPPDYVGGATISARAMRAAMVDSAKLVLRARGGRPPVTKPTLDVETFTPTTWDQMVASRALVSRKLTNAEVTGLIRQVGKQGQPEVDLGAPGETYITFYAGLATMPSIGRKPPRRQTGSRRASESQPAGTQTVLVAASGAYDFLGVKYLQKSSGNIYDRVRLVQGDKTFTLDGPHSQPLAGLGGSGFPSLRDAALFFLPPTSGFDPLRPWSVELLVNGTGSDGA